MKSTKLTIAITMGALLAALGTSAFADDAARTASQKAVELKDGSTLYIFKDGKMAMEDKYGHAVRMEQGEVMETKDGRKITMQGDEVARLDMLIRQGHEGG